VTAVVQARMSSTRLPGKVLAALDGTSTIELLLQRLRRSDELDHGVVATSTDASDDVLARTVERLGVPVVRGPLLDVLERYRLAAEIAGGDAIVRLTADCPLMDPEVVDRVVRRWRTTDADYVSNTRPPRSFPDGLDVEVLSRGALEAAAAEATQAPDREHVTAYVSSRPGRFRQAGIRLDPSHGDLRITLDTPEDLAVIRGFVERHGPELRLRDILADAGDPRARVLDA